MADKIIFQLLLQLLKLKSSLFIQLSVNYQGFKITQKKAWRG